MLLAYYTPPTLQQNLLLAPAVTRSGDSMSGLTWYPRATGTFVLPNKVRETGVQVDVASNLGWHGNATANLRQDNEVHRLRLSSRQGGAGFDTTFAVEGASRNGGFMDPLVRFWHSSVIPYKDPSLGVPPDGKHDLAWTNGGESYSAGKSSWRLSRAEAGIRVSPRAGLSLGAVVKVPITSGNLMERGGIDTAITVATSRMAGPWQLTWEGQHVFSGNHSYVPVGVSLAPNWGMQVFHASRMLSNRWAVGIQYEDIDAGYDIGLPWSGNKRRQMSFTLRSRLSNTDIGELTVSENVRPFRTTPYVSDVIFVLAVRRAR